MERKLVKKSYGLVLLCSLSLLMVLISSCQQSKLKAVITVANKQCPIDMGEVGTITSIAYDGDNVVYTLNMNEKFTDISVLKDNPESMKESIKIMFGNPSKEVKQMLELVAECNAGLEIRFVGKDSGEQAICGLTTEELKETLQSNAEPSQSESAKLEAQVKMANLQFPMQASDEIVVEKIEVIDEAVTYLCVVDEDLCPINQIEANAVEVKKGIVATLGGQTDAATQLFLQTCINCNKNITYRYTGKQSGAQYDIVIPLPELKKMIVKKK